MVEVGQDNPVPFLEPRSPTAAHVPCREAQEVGSVPKVGRGDVAASQPAALTHPLGDVLHELGHPVLPAGDEGLIQCRPLQAVVDGGLQSRPQPPVRPLPQLFLTLLG